MKCSFVIHRLSGSQPPAGKPRGLEHGGPHLESLGENIKVAQQHKIPRPLIGVIRLDSNGTGQVLYLFQPVRVFGFRGTVKDMDSGPGAVIPARPLILQNEPFLVSNTKQRRSWLPALPSVTSVKIYS